MFILGFMAFAYLGISAIKKVRNEHIDHVHIGDALILIVDGNQNQIEYIDVRGENQIVIENDTVVKIENKCKL